MADIVQQAITDFNEDLETLFDSFKSKKQVLKDRDEGIFRIIDSFVNGILPKINELHKTETELDISGQSSVERETGNLTIGIENKKRQRGESSVSIAVVHIELTPDRISVGGKPFAREAERDILTALKEQILSQVGPRDN